MKNIYPITLSLAGICQSANLVQQLAYSGTCDKNSFNTCLISILEVSPTSFIKIYGNNEKNLTIGLKILISILTFTNFPYSYFEFITYFFKMIILEKKLKENFLAIHSIRNKILSISSQYYIHSDIKILTNQIAKLYSKHISILGSQFLIKGLKNFLKNLHIQEKIRCLLFSGIRSVFLWKQFYGNQFQLIYFRNIILRTAKKILYRLKNTTYI